MPLLFFIRDQINITSGGKILKPQTTKVKGWGVGKIFLGVAMELWSSLYTATRDNTHTHTNTHTQTHTHTHTHRGNSSYRFHSLSVYIKAFPKDHLGFIYY